MHPSSLAYARRDFFVVAPHARLLIWELPFWLGLTYCALMPGSVAAWWEWTGVPVRSAEGLVAILAAIYLPAAILFERSWPKLARGAALLIPMVVAVAYAFASTYWAPLDSTDAAGMRWSLVFAVAAPLLAWSLAGAYGRDELYHFLWRLTLFLAGISVLYAAESILSLGLRSELGQNTLMDFGIERVRGPLYGSSTGYLVLLPALAFSIQHVIDVRARRVAGLGIALALLTAILGLGSRAALLLLSAYLVMLCFLIKNARKRLIAMLLIVLLTIVAAALVFSQATTERLESLEDNSRRSTHLTSLRMLEEQDWQSTAAGAGYGGIWNWYVTDARYGERLATGDNLIRTPYGPALYHSHSTLLEMTMELGLIGAIAFAAIAVAFVGVVVRCWRNGHMQALACGLATTGLGLLFDLFLFKNTTVNLIWWAYALGAAALAGYPRSARATE